MRKFYSNKLWRDKSTKKLEKDGSVFHTKNLSDAEYNNELRKKLIEEADEVRTAKSNSELIEEIIDIYEVIDALCHLHNISKETLSAAQDKKREQRGGYSERLFVVMAEFPKDSFGEKYCLNDPSKYPEITD